MTRTTGSGKLKIPRVIASMHGAQVEISLAPLREHLVAAKESI